MSYLSGMPKELPDQPVPAIDPKVEQLARTVVDGLIARLAAEPAIPATSLLEHLADQFQQAAALRRLGVVRRTPTSETPATPRQIGTQRPSGERPGADPV